MIEGTCGHCGGTQLDRDYEDNDIFCLNCGWRKPPDEVSDLPKRTAGVDRQPRDKDGR
jgi:DNA-directed RNA polymerase subunit RPC12/RpoP